jgi:hypothetical protein
MAQEHKPKEKVARGKVTEASAADERAGLVRRVLRRSDSRNVRPMPPFGTPEWHRWMCGKTTRFCGHGYHEGGDKGPLRCEGQIVVGGGMATAPCLCECHDEECISPTADCASFSEHEDSDL